MTYEQVYSEMLKNMKRNNFSELRILKGNTATVYCFGKRIAKIFLGKRLQYLELFMPTPFDDADTEEPSNRFELVDDLLNPLTLAPIAEQLDEMWGYARRFATIRKFGCCSSFEACSETKQCLHLDELSYWGCMYMSNLENGRIFYGKDQLLLVEERQ